MNQGATNVGWAEEEPQIELAEEADSAVETTWEAEVPRNRSGMIAGLLLALLGVGWTVALGVTLFQASPGHLLPPLTLAAWIGLGSGPLALLAVLYLLLLRTGRAEANAYARASARLRADSAGLAQMLALLTSKIDEARAALNDQAAGLQTLGNEAGERIGRAAVELSEQAASVGRTVATLNDATAIAREDLSVLLTEIPNAETVTRRLAEGLRESGAEADTRARCLVRAAADAGPAGTASERIDGRRCGSARWADRPDRSQRGGGGQADRGRGRRDGPRDRRSARCRCGEPG